VVPVIDVQTLNDALVTLALCAGLAVLIAVAIVAAGAVTRRIDRKEHVREVERHLAAVAKQQDRAAAR
jgi:hypothetical protein